MAKANRGKLDNGMVYQQVRDPRGAHYQATTPAELHNLLSQGYSLPDGVEATEAAEYLSVNVTGEPAATTEAPGSAGVGTGASTTGGAGSAP